MANTSVANGSVLNIVKAAEKVITHYFEREGSYADFMGEGPGNVIQVRKELVKKKGDTMKNFIFAKLTGEGVTGDSTLEGNEVALSPYAQTALIDMIRHAVRLDGEMTEQRSEIVLPPEMIEHLGIWAKDFGTELCSYYLAGTRGNRSGMIHSTAYAGHASNAFAAPDSAHKLIAGAGTEAGLLATDKMNTQLLDTSVKKISLLQNSGTPMRKAQLKGAKGASGLVAFMPPEHIYDLEQDPTFQAALQHGAVRGSDNPMFTGVDYVWRGLGIKRIDSLPLVTNGAGGANYARTVICGAQALSIFLGGTKGMDGEVGWWKFVKKDDFDYYNQLGMAVKAILGVIKNRFNSVDLGTFTVDAAYTA